MEAVPTWLQTTGYIISTLISVGTLLFVYLRDKASIKKTAAETQEIDTDSDRQDSKLSLDWALQFRARMEKLEEDAAQLRANNSELRTQYNDLCVLNTNQNDRILRLENENKRLEKRVSELSKENSLLKDRVKELETENSKLKGDVEC